VAGLIAFYLQEVTFDIEWGWQVPALGSLIEKTSPFFIGFPSIEDVQGCNATGLDRIYAPCLEI
jgi:hypothetical protein